MTHDPGRAATDTDPMTTWVTSDLAADGTYIVSVHIGDRLWPLSREEAHRHAVALVTQAERAERDAALMRLFTGRLSMPEHLAGAFVLKDVRPDRPEVDEPGPLRLVTGVTPGPEYRPFLTLHLDGEPVGQWSVTDARQHALKVMEVVECVDEDNRLFVAMRGLLEAPVGTIRAVIDDLANYREARD